MTPFLLLAGLSALAYLPIASRDSSWIRSVIKTASVAFLALAATGAGAPGLLVAGLGLCALGDAFLSRDGDKAFMAGVASFAAGHLAYTALFLTGPDAQLEHLAILPRMLIAVGLVGLGIWAARRLLPVAGALRGPVLAYIPVILVMGLAALTLPPGPETRLAIISALAFIASDLVLAAEKFLLPDAHPARRVTPLVIWPLYWGAQAGFLTAFLTLIA